MQGLSEKDKQLMEEFLNEKRKSGKSDADIIKDATSKAGIFMVMMLSLMLILVFAIIMLTGGDPTELTATLGKVAGSIFPRMAASEQPMPISSDEGL